MIDLRILTGPCQLVIGSVFLWIAWRLIRTNVEARTLRLAPFVTEEGLRALLGGRTIFLALGLFLTTQGLSSIIFWLFAGKEVDNPIVVALGSMGMVWGGWSAYLCVRLGIQIWRNR